MENVALWQKNVKWGPFGFLTSILLQNIKNLKGDPLETLQNFRKTQSRLCRTKRKGDPSVEWLLVKVRNAQKVVHTG